MLEGYNSVIMMSFVFCSRCEVDKSDFMRFVNSVRLHCTILLNTTRLNETLTGLSREYVTFDQNGAEMQGNFKFLL